MRRTAVSGFSTQSTYQSANPSSVRGLNLSCSLGPSSHICPRYGPDTTSQWKQPHPSWLKHNAPDENPEQPRILLQPGAIRLLEGTLGLEVGLGRLLALGLGLDMRALLPARSQSSR